MNVPHAPAATPAALPRAARRGGAWRWRTPLATLAVASGLALLWEGNAFLLGTVAAPDDRGLRRVILWLPGIAALAVAALLERDGLGRGRRGWALIGLVAVLYAGGAAAGIYDDHVYGIALTLIVLLCGTVPGPPAFLLWPPLAMSVGGAHGMALGIDAESRYHGSLGGCLAGLVLVPPIVGLYALVRQGLVARPRSRRALLTLFAALLLLFLAWATWDLAGMRHLGRVRCLQSEAGYPIWTERPDPHLGVAERARQDAVESAVYGFLECVGVGVSTPTGELLRARGFAALDGTRRTLLSVWLAASARTWAALEGTRGAGPLVLGRLTLDTFFSPRGALRVEALAQGIAWRAEERAFVGKAESARDGVRDLLRLADAFDAGEPYGDVAALAAISAGVRLRRLAVQTVNRCVPAGVDAVAARAWRELLAGADPGRRPVWRAAERLLRDWKQIGWLRLLPDSRFSWEAIELGVKRPRASHETALAWEWLRGILEATADARPEGPALPLLAAPPASWFGESLAAGADGVLRALAAEVDGLRVALAVVRRGLAWELEHAARGRNPAAPAVATAEPDAASGARIGVSPDGSRLVAVDAAGRELARWELRRGR